MHSLFRQIRNAYNEKTTNEERAMFEGTVVVSTEDSDNTVEIVKKTLVLEALCAYRDQHLGRENGTLVDIMKYCMLQEAIRELLD